jgi:hypothetical protein
MPTFCTLPAQATRGIFMLKCHQVICYYYTDGAYPHQCIATRQPFERFCPSQAPDIRPTLEGVSVSPHGFFRTDVQHVWRHPRGLFFWPEEGENR